MAMPTIVPGSHERLAQLGDLLKQIPASDHNTAHNVLIGALSIYVRPEEWSTCLDTVARLLRKEVAA